MKKILSLVAGGLVVIIGVVAVSYLQHRFDQSDLRHAVKVVKAARPQGPQGPSIDERLQAKYQVLPDQVGWEPKIESKTQGIVAVHAKVPGSPDKLLWEVDLVRFNVRPVSPASIAIGKAPGPSTQAP